MITLVVYILVAALIFSLVYWALTQIPLPQPVRTVAIVLMVVIAVVFLLSLLPGVPGLALR